MKSKREKTKEQLISELADMRKRIAGLEAERNQAEEATRLQEGKCRGLAESISDVFFAFDKDLKYIYWNKASEELTGVSSKDALGKHLYEVFPKDEQTERAEKAYLQALKTGQPRYFENEYRLGEKHYFFEISLYPSDEGLAVLAKDITERKKMDEQLIVTDRLASVGELASGIAHELNNPLTGVIGFSDLLITKQDIPEDIREDLTIINREAVRAAQVAKHLLTFARKHPDEKQPTDINNIVQLVLDLREYEQRVNNIDVEAKLADDLPQILANDFQLQQVFLNIIINAEHFMTEEHGLGTLTIITEQVEDIIRVSITDDGPGIFPDNITHIFDPFYTTKEVGEGTGLGLSICYGVITEHGGKIYAESELGKGTTFTIELPVLKEE